MKRLSLACIVAVVSPLTAQTADWATGPGQLKTASRAVQTGRGDSLTVEEGWLAVPENRAVAASRLIQVHYLRVTGRDGGTPLVYLAGGPGDVASGITRYPGGLDRFAGLLAAGDLILFDQRGTLDPALRWQWDGPLPVHAFESEANMLAHVLEMNRRARTAVTARGVDLRGYTTPEAVEDLDALRVALGLDRVSLLGFSYGTHLTLAYLRRYDAHVENAVLIGTEGPDHTLKLPLRMDTQFRKLSALAAADPRIAEQIPDLWALLERVSARLEREPMPVTVRAPDGTQVEVAIGRFAFHMLLRFDIGDATDLPVFPRLLFSIDQGDPAVLRWFVNRRAPGVLGTSLMGSMTDASAGASPARLAAIRAEAARSFFGRVANFPFPALDEVLDPPAPPARYHDPVVSTVRTLFLSGDLDWNAPAFQAEEVRFGFPNSTHLIVEHAGHEQTFWQLPEGIRTVARFLAGEDVSEVTLRYRPLRFVPLTGSDPAVTHPSVRP